MSGTDHERPPSVVGPWPSFLKVARPNVDFTATGHVLCLDPGETTGWARFNEGLLVECGQWKTLHPAELADTIRAVDGVQRVYTLVFETYRIRGNKAKEHIGSEVLTIQHIGAIKVVADEMDCHVIGQSAGMAKGFATDAKLRRWNLYQTNKRHANDAIRHGCYYLLFGRK